MVTPSKSGGIGMVVWTAFPDVPVLKVLIDSIAAPNDAISNVISKQVSDQVGAADAIATTLNVPLAISGTPVTTATQGAAYAGFTASALGGTAPYIFSVHAGSLPAGVTLDAASGHVGGTPSANGAFTGVVIRVTDNLGATADLAAFTLTVSATLTISGTPGTTATAGSSYSFTPSTGGGLTPKTFSIVNAPAWATFTTATGQLTGTPPSAQTDSGIVISVTDANGAVASLPAFTITVAASGGGGPPAFDTTMTLTPTARQFMDVPGLVSALGSVPAGNMVTVGLRTLSGSDDGFHFRPWQDPIGQMQGSGHDYTYYPREIDEYSTIDTSSSPVGSGKAWLIYTYKNGAGETGSTVQYVVGLHVAQGLSFWNMGAKTYARKGGPLLTLFGDGTATAISSIKDHTGATLSGGNIPFEVFYGRIVWLSTDGTSTTYGSTRQVDRATALAAGPYTVVLNNGGGSVTFNIIDKQRDINPAPAAVIAAIGDDAASCLVGSTWGVSDWERGEVLMFEDGDYHVTGNPQNVADIHQAAGLNSTNCPQPPTAGTWNTMNLKQAGWRTARSRTPWGARIGDVLWSAYTGYLDSTGDNGGSNIAGGSMFWRFTNLNLRNGFKCEGHPGGTNTDGRFGWVQIDHNFMDVTDLQIHTPLTDSETDGLIDIGSTHIEGGAHHVYVHDNWTRGNKIAIRVGAEDSEVIGNRIDFASEDALNWAMWDRTPGSHASKMAFNFITHKWYGLSSHPDYVQVTFDVENSAPDRLSVYPVSATPGDSSSFSTAVADYAIYGNIGVPDSDINYCIDTNLLVPDEVPARNGTLYQLTDGEGSLLAGGGYGRFYRHLYFGNCWITNMPNAYYIQHSKNSSRFDMNTFQFDYYSQTISGRNTTDYANSIGGPRIYSRYAGDTSSGTIKNSFCSSSLHMYFTANEDGWGTPGPMTYTNSNDTASYDATTIAAVVVNPFKNYSTVERIADVIAAAQTKGAEAGRGAFSDLSKINHRARTWDTTVFT